MIFILVDGYEISWDAAYVDWWVDRHQHKTEIQFNATLFFVGFFHYLWMPNSAQNAYIPSITPIARERTREIATPEMFPFFFFPPKIDPCPMVGTQLHSKSYTKSLMITSMSIKMIFFQYL